MTIFLYGESLQNELQTQLSTDVTHTLKNPTFLQTDKSLKEQNTLYTYFCNL